MPYTTVVASTTITASWGNANVRDQVVTPFASASARSSAITAPIEGMLTYRTDSHLFEGYDGASYVKVPFVVHARKTSNQSITVTTTLQNDSALLWAMAANAAYDLDLRVVYNSNTTADIKFGWSLPASATMTWEVVGADTAGAVILTAGLTESSVLSIGGTGADTKLHITGTIITAGTAGSAQLTWAQNTSDAGSTTVKAGSLGRLIRV